MKLENYASEIITKKYETVYDGGIYKIFNIYGNVVWVVTNGQNEVCSIEGSYNAILDHLLNLQHRITYSGDE